MLQHLTLEVAPEDVERSIALWELLDFRRVEPPPALAETFVWLEREGTQIHLERNPSPTVPPHGHVAVVVEDFDQAVERLRNAGFEVRPGREHWGAARAKATAPGGHLVELMAAPPSPPSRLVARIGRKATKRATNTPGGAATMRRCATRSSRSPRRSERCSLLTSPTSIGPCSRWSTCRRP